MDPQRRSILRPKRTLIERYPRAFQLVIISSGLLIFFSRPIYDAFIRTDLKTATGKPKAW